jgi:hypothetical protein
MTRADDLRASREILLGALHSADNKDLAGLSRELRAVNAELASMSDDVGDVADDLRARRAARRTAP